MIGIDSANLGRLSMNIHRSSNGVRNSVGRLVNAGNAAESLRAQGDEGGLSMVSRLGSENRTKSALSKSMQNAVSYIQMQEAGLKKAHKIYERMSVLASQSLDPLLSDSDRALLSTEFDTLKQDSLDIRNENFQDKVLYDDIAAFVKKDEDFGAGLSQATPATYLNFSGNTDAWEVTKDVKFNSGVMTIDVNGGTSGERYILKQGSLEIFDTGNNWNTASNAEKYDYDRFIVEYSPGQNTTFQFVPLPDGNSTSIDLDGPDNIKGNVDDEIVPSDSNFDNKSFNQPGGGTNGYLQKLGLPDDGSSSGMDSYAGVKFTNQGQVSTAPADNQTTNLTLRIESTSLFQIAATYSVPATPSNYISLGDSLTLDPVGIGLMQDVSIATASDAASAVNSLALEIEGIGAQMATLGANLSKLEISGERLSNQVYLSEAGISRLTSDVLVDESTQLAKQSIRLQSSEALMAQAFSLNENILNTLLQPAL